MKKITCVILCMLILLQMVCILPVSALEYGDFRYEINNGVVTIMEYLGTDAHVTVPGSIDGMPVIAIGNRAFNYNLHIESVILPEGLIAIGGYAFLYCSNLTDISIPDSVREVGSYAFIQTPWIENQTDTFVVVGDGLLYQYNGDDSHVVVPEGIKILGDSSFAFCESIESVQLPDSLTAIHRLAFGYCRSLTEVIFPDRPISIGAGAFESCEALQRVTLLPSIQSIAADAFRDCTKLAIYGFDGSYAHEYAVQNNITFRNLRKLPVKQLGLYMGNEQVYTIAKQSLRAGALIYSQDAQEPTLIGALYRNGVLVDMKITPIPVTAEDTVYYTEPFDLTNISGAIDDYALRAFVWERSSLAPLAKSAFTNASTTEPYHFTEKEFAERLDGSTVTIPLTEAFAEDLLEVRYVDFITHNKTSAAINGLIAGDKDIIFTTYPAESDFQAAANAGVELECVPVVNDAFVFLTNVANPTKSLTQEQLRDIYSGITTDWSDFGAITSPLPIIAFQRNETSGSQTGMLEFMGNIPIMISEEERVIIISMGDLIDGIGLYANAIGYSYYYFAENQEEYYIYREYVGYLAVDGVVPTNDTIRNGQYPIITPYYAIIRKDAPQGGFARELLAYALSARGQGVAEQAGYVGVR